MEHKVSVVRARCRPVVRQALELVAIKERLSVSEALRELIREAAKERGLWPPSEAKLAELQKVTAQ